MNTLDLLVSPTSPSDTFGALTAVNPANAQVPIAAALSLVALTAGSRIQAADGNVYSVVIELPSAQALALLAQGAGIDTTNAANPDLRWMIASAPDFPAASYPPEGSAVLLLQGTDSIAFEVLSANCKQVAGMDAELRMLVYRRPQDPDETTAPIDETVPGSRREYVMPDNPL